LECERTTLEKDSISRVDAMKEECHTIEIVIPATRFSPGDLAVWHNIVFRVLAVIGRRRAIWSVDDHTGLATVRPATRDRSYTLKAVAIKDSADAYQRERFATGSCPQSCAIDVFDMEAGTDGCPGQPSITFLPRPERLCPCDDDPFHVTITTRGEP
jgi:hypothetical protein